MDEQQQAPQAAATQIVNGMAPTISEQDMTPPSVSLEDIVATPPAENLVVNQMVQPVQTEQSVASTVPTEPVQQASEASTQQSVVAPMDAANNTVQQIENAPDLNTITPQDARDHLAAAPQAKEGELIAKDKNPTRPKNKALMYILAAMILTAIAIIVILISA